MTIEDLAIADVKCLTPRVFGDDRGLFCETYSARTLRAAGLDITFVQDNQSISYAKGVVRGLHLQRVPFAQGKLVRVVRGAIFDVAVDLRTNSPTYGAHVSMELSDSDWRQLWIPEGFAHGFCTLAADTIVLYKTTSSYAPQFELGVAWNDPRLAIPWPVQQHAAILSEKDRRLPSLHEIEKLL